MGGLQGLASSGGYLYAAWKGEPDDDQILFSRWSGSGAWEPASPMVSGTVGGNTSAGPSLGVFGGSLYAAWKGEWSDPRLFFAKYSGSGWENQVQIPNAYSDVGPALCEFNSTQFIAAWKSFDQGLYFAIYDGSGWTAPSQISGVASSVGPALAAYGGNVYAVWKGEGSDESLWYAYYDGTKWSEQTQIPGVASSVGVSLATYGGKLYAVWKGEGSDESLWYAHYDGAKWSGQVEGSSQTQIPGVGSSIGAAIAEFKSKIYAMWKGEGTDVRLYNADFDGTTWSGQRNDIPGSTGPDPTTLLAAPAGGKLNYRLSDSKSAALTGMTVVITVGEDIATDGAKPYSFQVNCDSPAQGSGNPAFVWQQFGFRIATNELFYWVNCFRQQDMPNHPYINWDSRVMGNSGLVAVSDNRLATAWQLSTTLTTDPSGVVTGFTFNIAQPDGTGLNAGPLELVNLPQHKTAVGSDNLASILNCQVILVAENVHEDGPADSVTFSAGQGIFLCYETQNLVASHARDESKEQSNISYSPLPASYPNGEFYQFFGVGSV